MNPMYPEKLVEYLANLEYPGNLLGYPLNSQMYLENLNSLNILTSLDTLLGLVGS